MGGWSWPGKRRFFYHKSYQAFLLSASEFPKSLTPDHWSREHSVERPSSLNRLCWRLHTSKVIRLLPSCRPDFFLRGKNISIWGKKFGIFSLTISAKVLKPIRSEQVRDISEVTCCHSVRLLWKTLDFAAPIRYTDVYKSFMGRLKSDGGFSNFPYWVPK